MTVQSYTIGSASCVDEHDCTDQQKSTVCTLTPNKSDVKTKIKLANIQPSWCKAYLSHEETVLSLATYREWRPQLREEMPLMSKWSLTPDASASVVFTSTGCTTGVYRHWHTQTPAKDENQQQASFCIDQQIIQTDSGDTD